jgi:hypothetical protein
MTGWSLQKNGEVYIKKKVKKTHEMVIGGSKSVSCI